MRKKHRGDAIVERLPIGQSIVGAEIGVWKGQLSFLLLNALPSLHLYMVDRWVETPKGDSYFEGSIKISRCPQKVFDYAYAETLKRVSRFKGRHSIIKEGSVEASKLVEDESLDFCFIDADHSYDGVTNDLRAWYPKVKKGGWVCGHDWDHPDQGKVKKAVLDFFPENTLVELSYNRTWFVLK